MLSRRVFAVVRALIIAPLFIWLWTVFVPRWLGGPHAFEDPRPLGWIMVAAGAAIALPCIWQFAWRGLGTPAPFDPPRRLVISGPYRWVRNPMYLGFGVALIGEAIVFPHITTTMLILTVILWAAVSLFVVAYEEPTLRRLFGSDYEAYCRRVHRWIPRFPSSFRAKRGISDGTASRMRRASRMVRLPLCYRRSLAALGMNYGLTWHRSCRTLTATWSDLGAACNQVKKS